jgi:hypothetical protein
VAEQILLPHLVLLLPSNSWALRQRPRCEAGRGLVIQTKRVLKQKTDRQDAQVILKLMLMRGSKQDNGDHSTSNSVHVASKT